MTKYQKGFSQVIFAVIVAVLAIGGYSAYRFVMPHIQENETMMNDNDSIDDSMVGENSMMEDGSMAVDNMGSESLEGDEAMMEYSGEVLAGHDAKFINFNKTDYESALKTDKLIVLYFYANWCPICKAEVPKLYDAFNSLNTDKVIGFRVNYNDNETDSNEVALAREHGVAYQHTKVFIRNGERIGKWPDSWDKNRYLSEIQSRL